MIESVSAYETVLQKIDIYMQKYIIPYFNPSKIYWWFSLSGGKDSFVMAHGMNEWYSRNNFSFHAEGFCVSQWNKNVQYSLLQKQITWMPVTIIDGVDLSRNTINYTFGDQAPCHDCSLIRKNMGDFYIKDNYKDGYINIIARGIHLSDMAISYLWRVFWDIDVESFTRRLEKGNPLVKLNTQPIVYLAKPLCFVREYETQEYANQLKFHPICCGCPACRYPSRRDIVEESLKQLFSSVKWEFEVYGINDYLKLIGDNAPIEEISLSGLEIKRAHLPVEFFDYMVNQFKNECFYDFSKSMYFLDDVGANYLTKYKKFNLDKIISPKLCSDIPLTFPEKSMIATVGPLWGSIGYQNKSMRNKLLKLQTEIYHIQIDCLWSQVIPMLRDFYSHTFNALTTCYVCNIN
ncbi:MAG: hypothetical protein NC313_04715 [Butyrivibrio sp.]|nr:hypothetical protein [Butyrivibrio sp.]